MLTNRPLIVTQSDPSLTALLLQGSPYSPGFAARCVRRSCKRNASGKNRRLGGMAALKRDRSAVVLIVKVQRHPVVEF